MPLIGRVDSESFRITSGGDVGIGTDNPTAKLDVNGTVSDSTGGLRTIPQNAQATTYALAASDVGKHVSISSGNITVLQNVFSVGDIITIYNNSTSSISIQSSGTTLRKAGTVNTGNCSLAEYGTASILCVASNVFVVSGNIV